MHISKRELVLIFLLHLNGILLAEEFLHHPSFTPLTVFLGRHQDRRIQIRVANLRTDIIDIGRIVVLYRLPDVIGTPQVESRGVEVFYDDWRGLLHTEARA